MGSGARDRGRDLLGVAVTAVALAAGCTAVWDGGDGGVDEDAGPGAGADQTPTVIWFLPPASDTPRDNAEDAVYRLLDDGEPASCTAAVEVMAEGAEAFATGPRGASTYLAGARLCLGDRSAAVGAFADARLADWSGPVDAVTARRACTVWDQVARLLVDRDLPCTLDAATAPSPRP